MGAMYDILMMEYHIEELGCKATAGVEIECPRPAEQTERDFLATGEHRVRSMENWLVVVALRT